MVSFANVNNGASGYATRGGVCLRVRKYNSLSLIKIKPIQIITTIPDIIDYIKLKEAEIIYAKLLKDLSLDIPSVIM